MLGTIGGKETASGIGVNYLSATTVMSICPNLKECADVEERQLSFVNCVMSDCCRIIIGDHSNEDEIAQVCHGQGMIITTPLSDLIYCVYSYLEYCEKRWFQRIKTLD